MPHKRKGQLTVSVEWVRHLRKFLRRQFWKGERKAGKKLIRKELTDKRSSNNKQDCRASSAPMKFYVIRNR